jgi:hypothetical protein
VVFVSEEKLAELRRTSKHDRLAMTPDERQRIGTMFRIQLPIVDRATLRAHAALLRRLATFMDVASTQWEQRDVYLMSCVKHEVALVNNHARHAIRRSAEQSGPPDTTQNMDGEGA